MNKTFVIAGLLVLTGCGGGGGNSPSPVSGDAFTNDVRNVAASSPDNIEPSAIDNFTATQPDNTEPEIP